MTKPRAVQPRHIPSCIREVLALHEALRRLGFSPEDIFVAYHPNQIAVVLRTQGKEFVVVCGSAPNMAPEHFGELWRRACALWNGTEPGLSKTNRQRIYENSAILGNGGGTKLVAALILKDFHLPCDAALGHAAVHEFEDGSLLITPSSSAFPSPGGNA